MSQHCMSSFFSWWWETLQQQRWADFSGNIWRSFCLHVKTFESRETKGNTIRGSTWQWREGPYRKSKLKAKHATSGFLVNNKTFVAAAERRCSGYFMSHVSDANLKHTLSEIQQSSSCSDNAGMLLWTTKCQLSFICPLNSIKNIDIENHCRW